jgi:hypothetical protein
MELLHSYIICHVPILAIERGLLGNQALFEMAGSNDFLKPDSPESS